MYGTSKYIRTIGSIIESNIKNTKKCFSKVTGDPIDSSGQPTRSLMSVSRK